MMTPGNRAVIDGLRGQPANPERYQKAIKAGGIVNDDGSVTIRANAAGGIYDLTIDESGRIEEVVMIEAASKPSGPGDEIAFPAVRLPVEAAPGWEVKVLRASLAQAVRAQGNTDGSLRVKAQFLDGSALVLVLNSEGRPAAIELPAVALRRQAEGSAPAGSLRQRLLWSGGKPAAGGLRIRARPADGEAIGNEWTFDIRLGSGDRVVDVGARMDRLVATAGPGDNMDRLGAGILAPAGTRATAAEVLQRVARDGGKPAADGAVMIPAELDDGTAQVLSFVESEGRCCRVQFATPAGGAATGTIARRVRTASGFNFDILVRADGSAYLPALQYVREAPKR
ncbi:MAG TPA: hypothetical protein VM074_07440 [Solimonas sp.]|nr:hypothetical protein [Solimonas sp.]